VAAAQLCAVDRQRGYVWTSALPLRGCILLSLLLDLPRVDLKVAYRLRRLFGTDALLGVEGPAAATILRERGNRWAQLTVTYMLLSMTRAV
jgi:hypothetical protein